MKNAKLVFFTQPSDTEDIYTGVRVHRNQTDARESILGDLKNDMKPDKVGALDAFIVKAYVPTTKDDFVKALDCIASGVMGKIMYPKPVHDSRVEAALRRFEKEALK